MTHLERAYRRHDRARENLRGAESNLKTHVTTYARQNGLLTLPRPETLRAQLGL